MKMFGKWRKEEKPAHRELPAFPPEDPAKAAFGQSAQPIITSTPEGQAPAEMPDFGKNRTILVVDDNNVVLKAFELKLKALGFRVITASDGSSAVSTARQDRPDLIVLDINFPPEVGSTGLQWDGFNIMEWMRRFREVADIPVVVITSGDPAKYKARAMASGAAAFFQKPINHEEFLVAVRRILGQKKTDPATPAA
jgi:two-component system, cell cycle response regulator DivK